MVAIVALAHDVVIPAGVFAVLGHFFIDYQVNVLLLQHFSQYSDFPYTIR